MLYLTRKVGQTIIINEKIKITVVETHGNSIKLGFEFPPEVSVLRKELHDRVHKENQEAAQIELTTLLGGAIK